MAGANGECSMPRAASRSVQRAACRHQRSADSTVGKPADTGGRRAQNAGWPASVNGGTAAGCCCWLLLADTETNQRRGRARRCSRRTDAADTADARPAKPLPAPPFSAAANQKKASAPLLRSIHSLRCRHLLSTAAVPLSPVAAFLCRCDSWNPGTPLPSPTQHQKHQKHRCQPSASLSNLRPDPASEPTHRTFSIIHSHLRLAPPHKVPTLLIASNNK